MYYEDKPDTAYLEAMGFIVLKERKKDTNWPPVSAFKDSERYSAGDPDKYFEAVIKGHGLEMKDIEEKLNG